jgi:phosphoribosylanthranilate isomerase
MRTRVKICGITRAEDALMAARLGADAIGMVFYEASPRIVTIEQAQTVLTSLPPLVSRVGLFVDADEDYVLKVIENVPLDLLQFHGDESPQYCRGFNRPYIKALRMKPGISLQSEARRYTHAAALLLDSFSTTHAGGTGETFDWSMIESGVEKPVMLAGGLKPENVAAAIRQVRPYAVDVSSGVESKKGIKDAAKMTAFINEVNKQS